MSFPIFKETPDRAKTIVEKLIAEFPTVNFRTASEGRLTQISIDPPLGAISREQINRKAKEIQVGLPVEPLPEPTKPSQVPQEDPVAAVDEESAPSATEGSETVSDDSERA